MKSNMLIATKILIISFFYLAIHAQSVVVIEKRNPSINPAQISNLATQGSYAMKVISDLFAKYGSNVDAMKDDDLFKASEKNLVKVFEALQEKLPNIAELLKSELEDLRQETPQISDSLKQFDFSTEVVSSAKNIENTFYQLIEKIANLLNLLAIELKLNPKINQLFSDSKQPVSNKNQSEASE